MQLHTRSPAVGSHGRIVLGESHVDGVNLRVSVGNGADNPACHMFEKARGDRHLSLEDVIEFGIADGIRKVIGFHGAREVIFHSQRNGEVRTHRPLLGHYPMKGMEADIV